MSKVPTLRAVVNERLAAAADEIAVLFERTTAQYEQEVCRSEEENQRKQRLLDQVLSPKVLLNQGLNLSLNQDFTETSWIKEEPQEENVSQEEELLSIPMSESSALSVKTEESSLLQQRQTEPKKETQGEDRSSEPHFHSKTESSSDTDNDDNWDPPFSCTAAPIETNDRSTRLSSHNSSAPGTSVHDQDMAGAERKKHHCSVCNKRFGTKQMLQRHNRVHTGERPYSCLTCGKAFARQHTLTQHKRTHTGEKLYSCLTCGKAFAHQQTLTVHIRTHTGEKPFSCPTCKKTFRQSSGLIQHRRTHRGEPLPLSSQ